MPPRPNPRLFLLLASISLLMLAPASLVAADDAADDSAENAAPKILAASRTETAPTLDGDVLGDPAWSEATAAEGFVQNAPDEGRPATERTEVFITYDDENLYVGVVCHDRDPSGIIVSEILRDASLKDTDSFQILLDTFDNDQSAFIFGTNPAAIQYDGQVTRDGLGENGGLGNFDVNWDGNWSVAASRFDAGWSAEMAIPFRTLRYPATNPQTWGVNFQRNIRRHNETAFWSPIPRQFNLTRVSLAGRLDAVEPAFQRLLQLTPYVVAEVERGRNGSSGTEDDGDAGFDLKYGLTPSLTFDATYNPDFAQVEADVQRINFDRFGLFFPEKRPFFLENGGLFKVGLPAELELFFSRRIGLAPDGREIPIDGGVRLSGQSGKTRIGMLYMRTDELEPGLGDEEFGVLRVSQDLGDRSSVGFILTNRDGRGADDYGRTFGVNGTWGVSQKLDVKTFLARTETPGRDGDDHAFRLGMDWKTETLTATFNVADVGEDFNPEMGFLWRPGGYRKADGFVLYRYRPKNMGKILELQPHIFHRTYWDIDDKTGSQYTHVDNHWVFKNGAEIHTGINFQFERVLAPFVVAGGAVVPAGTYEWDVFQFGAFSNRSAPISYGIGGLIGGFFNGDRVTLNPSIRFRSGEKLKGELVYAHNEIDLPGGDFETDLGRLRLSYAFTPKLFVEGLLQYNNTVDQWSANLRFGWRDDSNNGLYVVYNGIEETGVGAAEPQRRLIVKYSRMFDLFRN